MIVPTEEKAWIQSNNYGTCLEGKGHLAAEAISNKASWKGTLPQKREELKKKKRRRRRKSTTGEKDTMVWAHVCASCQYWQLLKTFKEVKTLFSVYKSSVL